ncbi:hypothetical protein [Piscinibacter terrae]|uniref:Uncharacterized protein n=1 Tax=Piscinibacter terrae TaxID=2496871 RepID=A0A3N7JS27_9BURK|nr:hypothetical protein [Albitalea terrae]RQP21825.1 hypothetical protein DZC73_25640 [Albitalea terrae]
MQTKTLQQLTVEELAHIHLDIHGLPTTLASGWIVSGMGGLVTEILQSRGQVNTRIFSPLYGSFALLDQIGSCYTNLSMPPCPNANASGIKKALYYFGGMSYDSDEMKALYGLRNSLMHDGSILYRGRYEGGTWKGPFHHFILGSQSVKIVELPATPWDGNLQNLTFSHRTRINQRAFTDLAIETVRNARALLSAGKLGFTLVDGEIELYYRYLFHSHDEPEPQSDDQE